MTFAEGWASENKTRCENHFRQVEVIITSLFTWVKSTKNTNTHHTVHYEQAMGDGGEEELLSNRKMPKNYLKIQFFSLVILS